MVIRITVWIRRFFGCFGKNEANRFDKRELYANLFAVFRKNTALIQESKKFGKNKKIYQTDLTNGKRVLN